jgi:hypothetical protein
LGHPLTPSASPGRPSGSSNDRNFVRQDNLTGDNEDPRKSNLTGDHEDAQESVMHVQSQLILIVFFEKWANFAKDHDWYFDDWLNKLKACQPELEDTEEFRKLFAYFLEQQADRHDGITRSQEHPREMPALVEDRESLKKGIHTSHHTLITFIYIHIHIHTYAHTCIHTYINTYIHPSYIYISRIYAHTLTHTFTYTHITHTRI